MNPKLQYEFPEGFFWGSATASYQVEGGIYNNDWAEAGRKGKVPEAGESLNHYHLFDQDFRLAKDLGHNAHRISIEWSRIEPEEGRFDRQEIEHYRAVLDSLRGKGLRPFVTLWHFTLPLWFVEKGGFEKRKNVEYFVRYCKKVVEELDEKDIFWATINEPVVLTSNGWFRGNWPPFKKNILTGFKVFNNLARAHNESYKEIKKINKDIHVGIVKDNINFHSTGNIIGWFKARVFAWFWNHLFLGKIKNNIDSIGLNYYFHQDMGKKKEHPVSDMGWELCPNSLYYVLMELKKYNVPVYVAEAGLADKADKYRTEYIKGLVKSTYGAIQAGLDVRGFMYWSFMDNFEWAFGYDKHFGLVAVDRVTGQRVPRKSAYEYKNICENNGF